MPVTNKIVFVDDEPNILNALKRLLHDKADVWDMLFLTNPMHALNHLVENECDVIVTDLSMPGMTGMELLDKINALNRNITGIILTGTADLQVVVDAINNKGIFRFYTKPCPTETLIEGIEAALIHHHKNKESLKGIRTAALDMLPTAVVVVDNKARVIFMNRLGAQTLAIADGLFVDKGDIIRSSNMEVTIALHDCIKNIHEADPETAFSITRNNKNTALSLLVSKSKNNKNAIIFIADPDLHMGPSLNTLKNLFGLTDAESRLVQKLTEGLSMDDAAQSCGIKISTARAYLKQVFSKTGTNRQAELVKVILTTPQLYSDT